MGVDLMKRAKELDQLRSKHISEKLTIDEAQNIVSVWGVHLEHSGGVGFLFGVSKPESLLPFPKAVLQGALNKMEAYYHDLGIEDRVKLLEETETMLIEYTDDKEAIIEAQTRFGDKNWQDVIAQGLKNFQENQIQNGYLVDKKLWKLSKSRLEELEK